MPENKSYAWSIKYGFEQWRSEKSPHSHIRADFRALTYLIQKISELINMFSNEIFLFSSKISGDPLAENKVTSKIESWQVKRSYEYSKIEWIWLIWLHRRIFSRIGRSETKGKYSRNLFFFKPQFLSQNIHLLTINWIKTVD